MVVWHLTPPSMLCRQYTKSDAKTNFADEPRRCSSTRAALETPSPPQAIAEAYRLTAMELRVLLAIVEVGGVPEVAEALGVAESTIKTHLGRIFAKTNLSRQADLVKLVAGFASPLAG
jgi:DNA-binding CsgD family transcriptional regulator